MRGPGSQTARPRSRVAAPGHVRLQVLHLRQLSRGGLLPCVERGGEREVGEGCGAAAAIDSDPIDRRLDFKAWPATLWLADFRPRYNPLK